jgi:hypothetical protein
VLHRGIGGQTRLVLSRLGGYDTYPSKFPNE